MIGADHVAKSAADGYTIMLLTGTYTTSAAIQPKLPFDPVNDLTGVNMVGVGPFMVTVHPSLPVKSVKELIALAKARPGELNYGTAGTGSIIHFATEVFAASANINIVHVPYKSGGARCHRRGRRSCADADHQPALGMASGQSEPAARARGDYGQALGVRARVAHRGGGRHSGL